MIEAETARVYLEDESKWIEAMPGRFSLARALTNASIVGVGPEHPEPSGWIENWAILVTAIDDDSLRAEWSRVVNNLDTSEEALPVFSMAATGVFKRVPQ